MILYASNAVTLAAKSLMTVGVRYGQANVWMVNARYGLDNTKRQREEVHRRYGRRWTLNIRAGQRTRQ